MGRFARIKFAVYLVLAWLLAGAILASAYYALVSGASDSERAAFAELLATRAGALAFAALAILAALGMLAETVYRRQVTTPRRYAEDIQTLLSSNPAHRLEPEGSGETRELARAINLLADRHASAREEAQAYAAAAREASERDRSRLAALLGEIEHAVIVCNRDAQILFYNERARALIANPQRLGLGRSIFGLLEREPLGQAIETMHERLKTPGQRAEARYVAALDDGRLVRVRTVPVLDAQGELNGFVLTLEDITRAVEQGSRHDSLLRGLVTGSRNALANARAAVETLLAFPDMDEKQRARFTHVIADEVGNMSVRCTEALASQEVEYRTQWTLEAMFCADLLEASRRHLENRLAVKVDVEPVAPCWLRVDSYLLVHALASLVERLRRTQKIEAFRLRVTPGERWSRLDLLWNGAPTAPALADWSRESLIEGGASIPITLAEVLERHGAEIWSQAGERPGEALIRITLPAGEPAEHHYVPASTGSRPVYYDFDLFHQAGQNPELDERPLAELRYTVFDTETTGLEPSAGDEIISIGAVRIVNGRLLEHEVYEQLVDPRRPLARESVKIHGITPEMVAGQPGAEFVLPQFHAFCEGSVLVAHNAAFDMRFLQLKEAATGARFDHPVLDTLLLSTVVHPTREEHKLEAIATRMGVNVFGRHTALGDAMVTAEIFLRLIPLLQERGIVTLGQARAACAKTPYAKISY
jgi:DNA polymerase-3 subunit epsilon